MSRINVANFRHPDGTDDNINLDSSGRVGLGTSSPAAKLDVSGNVQFGDGGGFDMNANGTRWQFSLAGTERMRIDSSGNVGIGTTAPSQLLELNGASNPCLLIKDTTNNVIAYTFADDSVANFGSASAHPVVFRIHNNEAARIDASNRLLVGTSSSSASARAVFQGNSFGGSQPGIIYLQRDTSSVGLTNGNPMGYIIFGDNAGSNYAVIGCEADGSTGTSDYPSRLTFSVTRDGQASPTESFRISSTGAQSSVIPGGSTLYPQFGCRAWVNFDGTTATPSTIRGSGNVSSITKNGTGDYTLNFTTAMPDANYSWAGGDNSWGILWQKTTMTASQFRFETISGGGAAGDRSIVAINFFR